MRIRVGEKEYELHALVDVPKVAAAGALLALRGPGDVVAVKTLAGETIPLRYNDAHDALQQVIDAA